MRRRTPFGAVQKALIFANQQVSRLHRELSRKKVRVSVKADEDLVQQNEKHAMHILPPEVSEF